MRERPESSVMVSIEQLLRDAQLRDTEEKAEAERRLRDQEQRRADALRLEAERRAALLRAEEEERARRAFEEQRRQTELAALQHAAVERARLEAAAKARLAEMASLQEHERQLRALAQDNHRKRLQLTLAGLAVLLVAGAVAGGFALKRTLDDKEAALTRARALEDRIEDAEAQRAKVERDLANATDPAVVAALRARLDAQDAELKRLQETKHPKLTGPAAPVRPPPAASPPPTTTACSKGDPMCPTVP